MHTHAHVLQEGLALLDVAATDLIGGLVDKRRRTTQNRTGLHTHSCSGLTGLALQAWLACTFRPGWPAPSGLAGLHLRPVWPALQA